MNFGKNRNDYLRKHGEVNTYDEIMDSEGNIKDNWEFRDGKVKVQKKEDDDGGEAQHTLHNVNNSVVQCCLHPASMLSTPGIRFLTVSET